MNVNGTILQAPVPAREPRLTTISARAWWRRNLFGSAAHSAATLGVGALAAFGLWELIDWAIINAVWQPDVAACRALDHRAACWGVIAESKMDDEIQ